MDYSPPGSSVHGILQAKILEWVAISFSRACSQHRDQTDTSYISCTRQADSVPLAPSVVQLQKHTWGRYPPNSKEQLHLRREEA